MGRFSRFPSLRRRRKLYPPRTKLKRRFRATARCLAARVPSAARRGTVALCRMGCQNHIDACGGRSIIDQVKGPDRARWMIVFALKAGGWGRVVEFGSRPIAFSKAICARQEANCGA
jgi:hypothetical protein